MKLPALVLGGTLLASAAAHPSGLINAFKRDNLALSDHRGCQVSEDGSSQFGISSRQFRRQQNTTLPSSITVDVNFHIASTEDDAELITDDIVSKQFDVLREHYAIYNINLVLNSTERVVDNLTGSAFLVNEADPPYYNYVYYEAEYKEYLKKTRKGGYDTLNLYFFSSYSPGATGYCQFPTRDPVSDSAFWIDSCQISAETMPGMPVERSFSEWNLGHIAIHETGHWFGLNHTFAGGCRSSGDFVDDTPPTRDGYGCPSSSDTCPDQLGLDPIHNFMGYNSDDWCVTSLPDPVR